MEVSSASVGWSGPTPASVVLPASAVVVMHLALTAQGTHCPEPLHRPPSQLSFIATAVLTQTSLALHVKVSHSVVIALQLEAVHAGPPPALDDEAEEEDALEAE